MKKILMLSVGILAVTVPAAHADVRLPGVFADHLVLQRGVQLPIWGTADPGEGVTVKLAEQSVKTVADADGKWRVELAALAADTAPLTLTVSGKNTLTFSDVLVGEVWLASGQSNMGSPVSSLPNAEAVLAQAEDAELRFFTVTKKTAAEPQTDLMGKWEASNPQTAKGFSAVAYYFARELRRTRKCPVAVLHGSWGGTPIETWISLDGLKREPPLTKTLEQWEKAAGQYRKVQADPKIATDYVAELQRWKKEVESSFNAASKAYNAAKAAGKPVGEKPKPAWPEPTNPDPMGMPSPSRRPQTPAVSFNGMIAPLTPYAIRGVIWYQGEANGSAGLDYRALFPRLIQDWRRHWGTEFPFLYVQLPACGTDPGPVAESGWPWTREAQCLALSEPRTGMAITIDVGDPNNVHPADKFDVGQRLALLARRDVYGEKIVASGPLFRAFVVEGDKIRLHFRELGGGLTPGQAPWRAAGGEPLPTDRLIGFYIAGEDHKWVAAEAKIEGDSVLVANAAVPKPRAVRYGWSSSPRCNLYNREGLPASPFRTDTWPK
ncbi:MAG: sialate O-acetylesterase [Verrucomicrobiota bacterium]